MDHVFSLINRKENIFIDDINASKDSIENIVNASSFLVIGGAGSIGQAVTKEIFERKPKKLHVVDISENNLVELVRDLRSSFGYIDGDFKTFAIDCGSREFEVLCENEGPYDYVLNLSALKHVRSEKDPYTLMRMVEVNILNTIKTHNLAMKNGAKKYFCVSTDKAANPVNMMGASKRIMEMFLMKIGEQLPISTARFANVAFSDGSLLHGFKKRIEKMQPIAAPRDVKRYFLSFKESGQLCLMSALLGENRDIYFPKLNAELNLITFSSIAERYLNSIGYKAHQCESEQEARDLVHELPKKGEWPCYFFDSDTTGEKPFEEFYTNNEAVDLNKYLNVGIVKNCQGCDVIKLDGFIEKINQLLKSKWNKSDIVKLFNQMIPDFNHMETGKYLDGRM